jgi:hypothetical protein
VEAAPALSPAEPGTRWIGFGQADRQAAAAVRSRLPVRPAEQMAPGRDIGMVPGRHPGSDPAPYYPAGGSVHSAHRVAGRQDPSHPAGPGSESVGRSRRPAAARPRQEPIRGLRLTPQKAAIANDLFLLNSCLCNPLAQTGRPIRRPGLNCIDGASLSPSQVLTQPRGKSYSCRCATTPREGYNKVDKKRYSSFVLAQFLGHRPELRS